MAGRGPAPKDPKIRQRTNKKAGGGTLSASKRKVPEIPNPGYLDPESKTRKPIDWHALTVRSWKNAWKSPMASRWLDSDIDGLGRLALLWDLYYRGDVKAMPEIRLQEQRYGLSPLDRSRLNWELERGDEAETKLQKRKQAPAAKRAVDPRGVLMPFPAAVSR